VRLGGIRPDQVDWFVPLFPPRLLERCLLVELVVGDLLSF